MIFQTDFTEMNFLHLLLPLEILIIVMLLWKQKAFQMFCVRFYTNPVYFCVDIFYYMFKFSHSLFTFRLHGYAVQGNCRYICRSLM